MPLITHEESPQDIDLASDLPSHIFVLSPFSFRNRHPSALLSPLKPSSMSKQQSQSLVGQHQSLPRAAAAEFGDFERISKEK